jgi:hypothetical protein
LVTDTGGLSNNGGSIVFGANSGAWRFASIKGLATNGADNTTGDLAFSTRNTATDSTLTERLRITSTGNVGIGVNPVDTLHVEGNIYLGTSGRTIYQGGSASLSLQTNTGSVIFSRSNGASESARIDSSGRLLVGTSTSVTALIGAGIQAHGTGAQGYINSGRWSNDGNRSELIFSKSRGSAVGTRGIVQSNDGTGAITFTGDDGTNFVSCAQIIAVVDGTPGTNDMPGRLVFCTTADGASSPTERMRISSAGDIFFTQTAQTSPGVGNTQVGSCLSDSGAVLSISRASATVLNGNRNSDGAVVGFARSGTTVGTISVTTTATAYNTSSDYRLKENVVPLTGAIDRVNQLQVHRFNFIADPSTTVDGFLAHEAQAVVPECVTGTKDEVDDDGNPVYQGIDQSKLVPLLTAALQEALAEIESLKARVASLEP